ncbi:UDP-2,3-diacylglucosamine pyrophosphatase LpxH [Ruaniaceae bacterium KH17]|nr:UDP-2,3-diacylglucosamine pyrophosphatase LpxH [Ruaniaceae bacterium KH17]
MIDGPKLSGVISVKTNPRLTEAYRAARIELIDDTSRYIIMSDCHRGDGSRSDEFLKNKNTYVAALNYYWKNGFTYVEAGDGDELWEHKPKHIIRANRAVWTHLLPFHRAGRFIRMWGNHDFVFQDPSYVREHFWTTKNAITGEQEPFFEGLEPVEAVVFRHRETGQDILLVHGHQGDFPNDQAWRASRFMLRRFWRYAHTFGMHSPSSPTANSEKRHKVERNYVKWISENRVALICGHTHREKFPRDDAMPYFNSGSCVYPSHITGIEISDGTIALVRWRVDPNEDALLQVTRRVVAGPEPLSTFDLRRR